MQRNIQLNMQKQTIQEEAPQKGSEQKETKQFIRMTQTPIPKLVIQLGIPTTISMLVKDK